MKWICSQIGAREHYAIPRVLQCNGKLERLYTDFWATACLRVSTYRSLRGFEPMFFHMYDEPDYALQCVAAGWDVLYTPALTIRHHWTGSGRSELRNHHRHACNELWSTVMRCQFPQMLVMMAWRIFSQARFAASRGVDWLIREPVWWWDAIKGIPQALSRRHPVSWNGYKKWLSLP